VTAGNCGNGGNWRARKQVDDGHASAS
jgi:hypothetical protein